MYGDILSKPISCIFLLRYPDTISATFYFHISFNVKYSVSFVVLDLYMHTKILNVKYSVSVVVLDLNMHTKNLSKKNMHTKKTKFLHKSDK